jgi:1,4-alpha-glucan branching enzyme
MPFALTLHYDNAPAFKSPHLWIWYAGSAVQEDVAPSATDDYGFVYRVSVQRSTFNFKFKDGPGTAGPWEAGPLDRQYRPLEEVSDEIVPGEIWCRGDRAFVYGVQPATPDAEPAEAVVRALSADPGFRPGLYVPDTQGLSGLGANLLADGRVLFGLYHPNAARVHVAGSFNDWQRPGHDPADPAAFVELRLHRGYFGAANTWLGVTDRASPGDEYKFFVDGGVPGDHKNRPRRASVDPYARRLGPDFGFNNSVVVDPTAFPWTDHDWRTPDPADLILYELSVHGFTEGDPAIDPGRRGRFDGVSERIRMGYFERLGITALSLMPLAEVPTIQGPGSLGYDPSLYLTVERDFGSPDDLRALVDAAHNRGLAVLVDMVFNHTSNDFNPLWGAILEHPGEEADPREGGLYFDGGTPWGNRIATQKTDVQNMLIDACKVLITEFHVDGFRLDATHEHYMDHGFLARLAHELKLAKGDVLLVAENLPNQPDLNRSGYDGYAQWSELFHDKIKALLREGQFEGQSVGTDNLADAFFFSKQHFASHTNNTVNYCESHDEESVAYELRFIPALDNPAAKDRKGRLGIFATLVALGQPMLFMGQEFNPERPRNIVSFAWPSSLDGHPFFEWCSRLIALRRRYPGLRLRGYNPAETGDFRWILGPWMGAAEGGGKRVIGWHSRPNDQATDTLLVMLNFENHDVVIDLDLGLAGTWVKLADIDAVHDVPPAGTNSVHDPTALHSQDGRFRPFTLPSSSGFIYKFESGA